MSSAVLDSPAITRFDLASVRSAIREVGCVLHTPKAFFACLRHHGSRDRLIEAIWGETGAAAIDRSRHLRRVGGYLHDTPSQAYQLGFSRIAEVSICNVSRGFRAINHEVQPRVDAAKIAEIVNADRDIYGRVTATRMGVYSILRLVVGVEGDPQDEDMRSRFEEFSRDPERPSGRNRVRDGCIASVAYMIGEAGGAAFVLASEDDPQVYEFWLV